MFDKMKDLLDLKAKVSSLKRELASSSLDLEWFSGKIKMKINAKQEIQKLEIDGSFNLSAPDLSNKLLACFNEAIYKSQALAAEKTKQITGLNFPGL